MYNIYYIESSQLNTLFNKLKKKYKVFSPTVKEPNLTKENTKVSTKDGILTVSGASNQTSKTDGSSSLYSQQFSESMAIPFDVDQSKISATVNGNSLIVTLPKKEVK